MYDLSVRKREQTDMREWLRGGASPCQGEGRGFESRLALFLFALKSSILICSPYGRHWKHPKSIM